MNEDDKLTGSEIQSLPEAVGEYDSASSILEIPLRLKNDTLEKWDARPDVIDRVRRQSWRYALEAEIVARKELTIPTEKIGVLIGTHGQTINSIRDQTGATVDISDDGAVTIEGKSVDSARKATRMILDTVPTHRGVLLIPNDKVGHVIGTRGETIEKIQETTNAEIDISERITRRGRIRKKEYKTATVYAHSPAEIEAAMRAIRQIAPGAKEMS